MMNKLLTCGFFALVLVLANETANAQNTPPSRLLPGYLYPVETTTPNKKIYICGQRPINAQGQVVGKGDLNAQLTLIFTNLTKTLSTVGLAPTHIRQISYRVTDAGQKANSDSEQVINTLASGYFSQNKADVPTLSEIKNVPLQVSQDVIIEVEVVAIKE